MKTWYPGFDWLRVLFIASVLSMHLGIAQDISKNFDALTIDVAVFAIYYAGFCSAVPGFLLISCFLRAKKDPLPKSEHLRFLVGLLCLYVFWVGAWLLVTKPDMELSFGGLVSIAFRGGGWAFYYFAVLLMVHVIRMLISGWSSRALGLASAVILLLSQVFCLVLSHRGYSWEDVDSYWWPMNFLAIPFLGTWMAREEHHLSLATSRGKKWLMIFGTALLISLGLDWLCVKRSVELPALAEYLRATPTLMSLILVQCSFLISSRLAWVAWFAKNSLGVFCLHVFVLGGISKVVGKFVNHVLLMDVITLIATMISMSIAAEVMRYCLSKRVI